MPNIIKQETVYQINDGGYMIKATIHHGTDGEKSISVQPLYGDKKFQFIKSDPKKVAAIIRLIEAALNIKE